MMLLRTVRKKLKFHKTKGEICLQNVNIVIQQASDLAAVKALIKFMSILETKRNVLFAIHQALDRGVLTARIKSITMDLEQTNADGVDRPVQALVARTVHLRIMKNKKDSKEKI